MHVWWKGKNTDKEALEGNSNSRRDNLKVIALKKRGSAGKFYEVLLSDGSSLFLLKDIIIKAGIFKDEEISRDTLQKVQKESRVLEAERRALNLLSHSMHSHASLRLKLLSRGFQEEAVNAALIRVKELGYMDDAKYAEAWVSERIERNPEGRLLMLSKLIKKGISRALAESTIERLYSREREIKGASKVLAKITQGKELNREELYSKLYRKGFSYDIIRSVLEG
ncbi:MAG: RecX family transcriptional regulator [Spirochaetales bacterium]|nr:RecX family transcriptional regulator [Spirochaetales bacterium]